MAILAETELKTPRDGEPKPLVAAILEGKERLSSVATVQGTDLVGAGVSVAGFLDPDRSRISYNANLPLLSEFDLRPALSSALQLPVVLEVDSNASALAEHRLGPGVGARRLLSLTIGTGLGGGVLVDGELLRYCGECVCHTIILHPSWAFALTSV
jgi:glucokinase